MKRLFYVVAIGLAAQLAACSEAPEAAHQREQTAIAEAARLVSDKQYSEASAKLNGVTDSPEVAAIRKKAFEGRQQQEAERLAKEAVGAATAILAQLEALGTGDVSSIEGVKQTLNTFDRARSFLQRNEPSSLTDEGKKLRAGIRSMLARKQAALLPAMRSTYGKNLAETLWENDVEVVTSGNGNKRIRFIAGMFAANRNIASAQQAAGPMLRQLRFSRSQYEWYRGSEFTYYDMKPEPDGQVPE